MVNVSLARLVKSILNGNSENSYMIAPYAFPHPQPCLTPEELLWDWMIYRRQVLIIRHCSCARTVRIWDLMQWALGAFRIWDCPQKFSNICVEDLSPLHSDPLPKVLEVVMWCFLIQRIVIRHYITDMWQLRCTCIRFAYLRAAARTWKCQWTDYDTAEYCLTNTRPC